jgi:hypothetical protein
MSTADGARALLAMVLSAGLVLTLLAAPAGGSGWQETGRSDGIVVTERLVPGQSVPTFRGIGLVDADLGTVLAVILDVGRHVEWMQDCAEARLVASESEAVSYLYHRTNVPWPLSDRDVVLRSEVELVEPGRLAFVRFRSASARVPLVDGVVRVATLAGFYRLEAMAPAHTSVEYRVDVEPGGNIPAWVAHRATRTLPLATILGLRHQTRRVWAERPPLGAVTASASAAAIASEPAHPAPADGETPRAAAAAPQVEHADRTH